MEGKLPMRGGGLLRVTQEGIRVRLEAEREEDGRGLYKVWVWGQGGGRFLLGTLAPEGGRLQLRRSLAVGELERRGCWPVTGAESILAFPFVQEEQWYCEGKPARLVVDPVLRQQMHGPMLCSRRTNGFRLAAPFRTDSPVMLDTLMCFARVEVVNGRPHLVWQFDQKGQPVISASENGRGGS